MLKKKVILLTGIVLLLILTACGGNDTPVAGGNGTQANVGTGNVNADIPDDGSIGGNLTIWSFTNEALAFATAFQEFHPDIEIDFSHMPLDVYIERLQHVFASGVDVPDVVQLGGTFIRQFVESPFLMDISDLLPYAREIEIFQHTIDSATNDAGQIFGFAYQAPPNAMFYRRSMARDYLGTDDPNQVQEMFSDINRLMASAEQIRDASNGEVFFTAHFEELFDSFVFYRNQPWIMDNRLVISEDMQAYIDISRRLRDGGLEAQIDRWSEAWFAGMSDTLVDASGNDRRIFAYFFPAWGLNHVLQHNAASETTNTAGDWAMIPGPMPSWSIGSWLSVSRDSNNPVAAREFVKFVTLNPDTLANYSLGVYSNEFLRQINPDLPTGIALHPGDFNSSYYVARRLLPQFDTGPVYEFLGGQNAFDVFSEIGRRTEPRHLLQATDEIINNAFNAAVASYLSGASSRDDALTFFKNSILIDIPGLIIN